MKMKNILFATTIGLISVITHAQHITNVKLYDWDTNTTGMQITFNGGRSRGTAYPNDSIIIIKDASKKISADYIGNLQSIENAFMTRCSDFHVIEYGANNDNRALCKDAAILQAYEQFIKDQK